MLFVYACILHVLNLLVLFYRIDECLEVLIGTGRLPEAAFFARTYLPDQVSR